MFGERIVALGGKYKKRMNAHSTFCQKKNQNEMSGEREVIVVLLHVKMTTSEALSKSLINEKSRDINANRYIFLSWLSLNAVLNGMVAEEVLIPELYLPIWHEFPCVITLNVFPFWQGPHGSSCPALLVDASLKIWTPAASKMPVMSMRQRQNLLKQEPNWTCHHLYRTMISGQQQIGTMLMLCI